MWHLFFLGVYRENHKCEARALRSRAIFEDINVDMNYEVIYAISRCCVEDLLTPFAKPLTLISNISQKEVLL